MVITKKFEILKMRDSIEDLGPRLLFDLSKLFFY